MRPKNARRLGCSIHAPEANCMTGKPQCEVYNYRGCPPGFVPCQSMGHCNHHLRTEMLIFTFPPVVKSHYSPNKASTTKLRGFNGADGSKRKLVMQSTSPQLETCRGYGRMTCYSTGAAPATFERDYARFLLRYGVACIVFP